LAAAVHKGTRNQQSNISVVYADFGCITKELALLLELDMVRFSEFQNQVGPGIMTRPIVFGAGVSQPYD
jgi:hypothetical protein